MRQTLVAVIISLALGALIGLGLGWFYPVEQPQTGFDLLHPDYKADYTLMVSAVYASDGDLDAAQARMGRLAEPDPAAYVVRLTEGYIDEGRNPQDIRSLVGLSAAFGYITPAMQPYAPVIPSP
ncbi:MAG: hypothetical protein GYB68_13520 [Chloroflexi bacterium]|nr:hypothetical protein [Chloroflexota bacterium]